MNAATAATAVDVSHGQGAEHAEHESHLPTYVRVIITLAVLTAGEFAIAFWIAPGEDHQRPNVFMLGVLMLIGLAAWKAVLVARFFMHIKYDAKILALLAMVPVILGTPLVLLCVYDGTHGFGM